ncbi:MAG: Obg family GTPase CgtA [Candidatus Omnitrophica bacterium]|nr:Obg family GTPase CgtA [Candidatus Omnitrophota bacterium]
MIDKVKIYVKAGDGGSGCTSYKGIKFTRSRRPDGGPGGKGADIIIKVDDNVLSLEGLKFKQHIRAENGKQGQANNKKGADARPYIIKVPQGTIIRDFENDLLLRDLVGPEEELVVAKGGVGGKGNTGTKPATAGQPGDQRRLSLELKLIADLALIGYPNAGKSTLLSKLTSAHPKIAAYPFTTVVPFLGVLEFPDFQEPQKLILIELPGLVEGATQGKGLGAGFLRHAERAKAIAYIIDMSAQEGRDPWEDFCNIEHELQSYSPGFSRKSKLVIANKMDLPKAEDNLIRFSAKYKNKVYPVSALNGSGLSALGPIMRHCLKNAD